MMGDIGLEGKKERQKAKGKRQKLGKRNKKMLPFAIAPLFPIPYPFDLIFAFCLLPFALFCHNPLAKSQCP